MDLSNLNMLKVGPANPIDDPDNFPEYFPKPMYYFIEYGLAYNPGYWRHHTILPGVNYIEGYYPETSMIVTGDTVGPSIWAWFKSLWQGV
jgi:hypothetical protein